MTVFQTFFEIGTAISLSVFLFLFVPIYFMYLRKKLRG